MLDLANSTVAAFDNSILCLKPRGIGEIGLGSIDRSIHIWNSPKPYGLFEFGSLHSISGLFGLDVNDVPVSLNEVDFYYR